jgi:hypothetical protein
VLVAGGAVALVFGIDIRTQLIEMFSPGLSGALSSIVVALSPGHQAQVALVPAAWPPPCSPAARSRC